MGTSATNYAETIAALPAIGWVAVFALIAVVGVFLFGLYRLLIKKEVRLKHVEIVTPQQRKLYEVGANDLLENQSANARNLLSKIWVDIYDTGCRIYNITDRQEQYLLEDIAKLIDNKLQYAVHLDLIRNHIQTKSEGDLLRYSDAKAEGYRRMIRVCLHQYNAQLPNYPLAEILRHIPKDEFKKIFEEIYTSACNIAGKGGKND